jgi:hypothetical protein
MQEILSPLPRVNVSRASRNSRLPLIVMIFLLLRNHLSLTVEKFSGGANTREYAITADK